MSGGGAELRFPEERLSQGGHGHTRSNVMARVGNWQPPRKAVAPYFAGWTVLCKTLLCATAFGRRSPPVAVPPFPHKQPVPRLGPQRSKGAKRGEAVPLTARTGPYNLAFRKRGHGPLRGGGAAFDPGFGFFNFVSKG